MSRAGSGLAGATTRGVLWSAAAGVASKLLALASTFVLARLLVPEEFGVAAYALAFTSVLELLRGLGIGQALIFFPRDDRRSVTAFWLLLGNGLLLAILALACAPFAATFFRDPRAPGVIGALALYFPLLALGQVLDIELRRDLRFGRRFGPELARSSAKLVVALGLAAAGAGYWSLVAAQVAGAAVWSAALWVLVPWRPRLAFDRGEAARLLGYGKHLVAVALLVAVSLRADHLVIGRYLGAAALGVYTIAFAFPGLAFQASAGLSQVLFPAYAKLEGDRVRLRSAALRTLRLAAAAFVPLGAGMTLVAEPLVVVCFGAEWREAAAVVAWMGPWVVLSALTQHFVDVYKALGEVRVLALVTAVTAAILVPALVWTALRGGGLAAVVVVLIAVRVLRLVLDLVAVRGLIGLRASAAFATAAPALGSGMAMAAAVLALDATLPAAVPAAGRLAVLVAAGAAVYLGSLAVLDRGIVGEIQGLVRSAAGSRPPPLARAAS